MSASKIYLKKASSLENSLKEEFKNVLRSLHIALQKKDRNEASYLAHTLKSFTEKHFKKSVLRQFIEVSLSLLFALAVAMVVRQTAFEPYEIPSGSMRPTFREKDRLIVSKAQFGINIPLTTKHLIFQEDQVKRMGVVTFTGENMDIPNVKTRYFYIFPGYKQYIKRMVGLPGDTLYFYGGKIWGIDKNGKDISFDLQKKELSYLEHIPFIHIDGRMSLENRPTGSHIIIKQMNKPLASLSLGRDKSLKYEFLLPSASADFDLYDYWGMDNFASVRIVPKKVLENKLPSSFLQKDYYLELTHHPSVKKAHILRDAYFRTRPNVHTYKSYIPLSTLEMKTLWDSLYTGRLIFKDNAYYRFGHSIDPNSPYAPKISGDKIVDGLYEFFDGKPYRTNSQGMNFSLSPSHPLKTFTPEKCFLFFNTGIEADTRFIPDTFDQGVLPSRYAYFYNGTLFVMGKPFLQKESPLLQSFIESEFARQSQNPTYTPFIDKGAPLLQSGSLNIDFIKAHGLIVPSHSYLVLGDNHAMSADSREFGFVPEDNIRGVPSLLFWAPGGRFGFFGLSIYPWITLPKAIVWSLLLIGYLIYRQITHRKTKQLILEIL